MITDSGLNDALAQWAANRTFYIAVGTGTTAADPTDTAMETEIDRIVAGSQTVESNVLTLRGFFAPSEAVGDISEIGAFSALSGGTCFERQVLASVKTKTSAKGLIMDMTFSLTNG